MALYAQQISYMPQAWAALLRGPENRLDVVGQVIESLGGHLLNGWFSFGDYDALIICELPDNVSATALSMAVSAGGAIKSVKTTPLVTFEEGLEAMRKAADTPYTPPRSEIPYFGVYRGSGSPDKEE